MAMETIHLPAQFDDRYRLPNNIRNEFGALSGSSPLTFASRHAMAWRTSDSSYTTPPATAAGQSPLRYGYSHGSPDLGYDASTEPSPTFRPPLQTYEQISVTQAMRGNSPSRMSTRVGQARSRREVSDDNYPSMPVTTWEAPTRDSTPEQFNSDQIIDVADPRFSQGDVERIRQGSGSHRYSPYHTTSHSRTDSSSDHRSASPALSMISNDTSSGSRSSVVQSNLVENIRLATPARTKHRKQRLYTVDRRAICQMAIDHPLYRQEDIAQHFNIERSTVSKILKDKDRWLSTPAEPQIRVSKYRLAKYPSLEAEMKTWVVTESAQGQIFTDAMIRNKAVELGRKWKQETEGKFKASPGWVENFKARIGIRKGRYLGNGTGEQKADAQGYVAAQPSWNRWESPDVQAAGSGSPPSSQSPDGETNTEASSAIPQESPTDGWPQQEPAAGWPQQQTAYVAEQVVAPTYEPTHVPEQVATADPYPPLPDQSAVQTVSVDYASSGGGGVQPEGYDPDADYPVPEGVPTQGEPEIEAMHCIYSLVTENKNFMRHADLTADELEALTNISRAIHTFYHGGQFIRNE